jgi:stage II sporulation protein D
MLIEQEPTIRVGIVDRQPRVRGEFNGLFKVGEHLLSGGFNATTDGDAILLSDANGKSLPRSVEVHCIGGANLTFTLHDVTMGVSFHWERKEDQTFQGDLKLELRNDGTLAAINVVPVEQYLASVISSEMSAEAPLEFLKAQAITSRSWLVAMLERERKNVGIPSQRSFQREGELIRWYDREDHDLFDVCADDHCQRYQGLTKIISNSAADAVASTGGVFLAHESSICDARFSKSCGGLTERFESCWEETAVPYLQCVSDAHHPQSRITSEDQASNWIRVRPDAYCNTTDSLILRQILPSFDQETTDFFRWRVEYRREELEELLQAKSGIDFGTLMDLVPVQRGPSGRIVRLRIEGTKKTLTVGKELEIRRWLSKSHLYSSAFVVETDRGSTGIPVRFILHGAGWGHGVGLCQIGAAVMATIGFKAEDIVRHYFTGVEIKKLY